MKRFLALLCLILLADLVAAQERSKPNTLTAKEVADGWLLLFDGESTFGWRLPIAGSKWYVFDGMLYPSGTSKVGPLVTTTPFQDYELAFEFRQRRTEADVLVGCDRDGNCAPNYRVKLRTLGGGWYQCSLTFRDGRPRNVRFRPHDTLARGAGVAFPSKADSFSFAPGHIALWGGEIAFRTIKLRPLNARPLFNGKDLTGWTEVVGKGERSKFSVTEEGRFNVRNGPDKSEKFSFEKKELEKK